jgi:hypothetical protein
MRACFRSDIPSSIRISNVVFQLYLRVSRLKEKLLAARMIDKQGDGGCESRLRIISVEVVAILAFMAN